MPRQAEAQTSASYRLEQSTFNNGGNPSPVLTSASYQMSLDAIGDSIVGWGLSSASYQQDAGFVRYFPPPGEVQNLRFSAHAILAWSPEPSVGVYDLY